MKLCTKCKLEKSIEDFYKDNRKKDGLRSWCKECQLEDNRSRESKYNEARRKYREEHKEECRENKRKYYKENKDKILISNSKWRQTLNGKWLSYKESAKKRKLDWKLTKKEFKSFWNRDCFYCNSFIEGIGIDRKDNSLGYEIENCVPCCSICNTMKMDLTIDDFTNQIIKIWKNLILKQEILEK